MNKPIKNYGDVITLRCSTSADLHEKQYGYVIEDDIGEVKVAGTAANTEGYAKNVYVLCNAPKKGEPAQCGVLGSGQFRVKISTGNGAVAVGAILNVAADGFAQASTGGRILARADEAADANAGNIIVVNTQLDK